MTELAKIDIITKGVMNTRVLVDGQALSGCTRLVYDVVPDETPTVTVDLGTIEADVTIDQGQIKIESFEVYNCPAVEFAILDALLRKHADRLSAGIAEWTPLESGVAVKLDDVETRKVRHALAALVR